MHTGLGMGKGMNGTAQVKETQNKEKKKEEKDKSLSKKPSDRGCLRMPTCVLLGLVQFPKGLLGVLFRAPLIMSLYVPHFSKMFIQIRLNRDIYSKLMTNNGYDNI